MHVLKIKYQDKPCQNLKDKINNASTAFISKPLLAVLIMTAFAFVSETQPVDTSLETERNAYLIAAQNIVKEGVIQVRQTITRLQLQALGLAVLLLGLCNTELSVTNPIIIIFFLGLVKLVLAVAVAALVWLALVVKEGEVHGLKATASNLELLSKHISEGR